MLLPLNVTNMRKESSCFLEILSALGWQRILRGGQNPIQLLGFTSCKGGSGVTTVASQVAMAAALEYEARTLIVDCDFVRPRLHQVFQLANKPGICDAIRDLDELELSIQLTQVPNLHFIPAGSMIAGNCWIERSVRRLFRSLRQDYELIICDLPAVGTQPHAISVLAIMDRVLMVHDPQDGTSRMDASYAMLECQGVRVSGVILNQLPEGRSREA